VVGKWRPDGDTFGRCAFYMRTLVADAKQKPQAFQKNPFAFLRIKRAR
jgi:hypothetical protein